jgi:hypothetical protein
MTRAVLLLHEKDHFIVSENGKQYRRKRTCRLFQKVNIEKNTLMNSRLLSQRFSLLSKVIIFCRCASLLYHSSLALSVREPSESAANLNFLWINLLYLAKYSHVTIVPRRIQRLLMEAVHSTQNIYIIQSKVYCIQFSVNSPQSTLHSMSYLV